MKAIQQEIIDVARSYLDVREVGANNSGFNDETFQQRLAIVGWDYGQAWCAYFAELVWREAFSAFDTIIANQLAHIFSAGAVRTFENFRAVPDYRIIDVPIEGAVAIWRHYKQDKPTWMGHAGIVVQPNGDYFSTIEGNTNSAGGRDGQGVIARTRSLLTSAPSSGLHLMGFIVPVDWLS